MITKQMRSQALAHPNRFSKAGMLNGRHCVPLMVFKVTMFIQVRDRLGSGKKFKRCHAA